MQGKTHTYMVFCVIDGCENKVAGRGWDWSEAALYAVQMYNWGHRPSRSGRYVEMLCPEHADIERGYYSA